VNISLLRNSNYLQRTSRRKITCISLMAKIWCQPLQMSLQVSRALKTIYPKKFVTVQARRRSLRLPCTSRLNVAAPRVAVMRRAARAARAVSMTRAMNLALDDDAVARAVAVVAMKKKIMFLVKSLVTCFRQRRQ
jgi:hypothetical protein